MYVCVCVCNSATWPVDVRRIADRYMNQPVHVVVGSLDLRACRTVHQQVIYCEDENEKQLKVRSRKIHSTHSHSHCHNPGVSNVFSGANP